MSLEVLFGELVSGRRPGFAADLLRAGLAAAEWPYRLAVGWRNSRYDSGRAMVHRLDVPVVSVGNLTLGGTGKTPMVAWIAGWLTEHGRRVAIVSRGYKAHSADGNDEARELAALLPGVLHLQDADRVAAGRRAVQAMGAQVLVLDDAFQHRRIARDLDLVMLDALEPLGFGRVFPRGLLREPPEVLRRAGVIALSRADLVDCARRAAIRAEAARLSPGATWIEVRHAPRCLLAIDGSRSSLEQLFGQPVAAFCGLGNPDGFRRTLQQCGYTVAGFRAMGDHHCYSRADLKSLEHWGEQLGVSGLLCTHKDLVKIDPAWLERLPLWAVCVAVEFLHGQVELEQHLERVLSTHGRNGETAGSV